MKNRLFGLTTLVVVLALLALGTTNLVDAREKTLSAASSYLVRADEGHHNEHFAKCAKACSACQLECASCFNHCVKECAEGKKDHASTARTCADCDKCCALAASLCASNSPMAKYICEGCARCCDDCATACEKFPDDKHMATCAKSCRDCAKECREMIKHVAH